MASESPIFVKTFDFLKWIISRTEKFPKSQRFFLAGRINNAMFDFYEVITEAVTSKDRKTTNRLYVADARLYNARHYIRLAKELEYLSFQQYEYAVRELDELGKLLGGWIKKTKYEKA